MACAATIHKAGIYILLRSTLLCGEWFDSVGLQRHFRHYWFAIVQVFVLTSAVCVPHILTQFRCSHLYVQITVQVCGCVCAHIQDVEFLHCNVTCYVVYQAVPGEDGEGAVPDRDQRPAGPAVRDA